MTAVYRTTVIIWMTRKVTTKAWSLFVWRRQWKLLAFHRIPSIGNAIWVCIGAVQKMLRYWLVTLAIFIAECVKHTVCPMIEKTPHMGKTDACIASMGIATGTVQHDWTFLSYSWLISSAQHDHSMFCRRTNTFVYLVLCWYDWHSADIVVALLLLNSQIYFLVQSQLSAFCLQ